jgi:hypothetical protein
VGAAPKKAPALNSRELLAGRRAGPNQTPCIRTGFLDHSVEDSPNRESFWF